MPKIALLLSHFGGMSQLLVPTSDCGMQKIYINGRFLSQPLTGVQRFATQILSALDTHISSWHPQHDIQWIVLVPRDVIKMPQLQNMVIRTVGKLHGVLWEQLDLPRFLHGELLLNFGSTGPLLCTNQIVTVHDAQVVRQPSNFQLRFQLWYKFLLPRLGQRAKKIVTVSEFSKNEVAECFNISKGKFEIVYNSAEHIRSVEADDTIFGKHNIPRGNYVLCIGGGRHNKNTGNIRKALDLLNDPELHLVEVGNSDSSVFNKIISAESTTLHAIGQVRDGELRALYEQATCFVFPSLYEGFGIPPIEAMLCRCPTIVSNRTALPEVCGDAALYVDSIKPQEIADAVYKLRSDDLIRERIIDAGVRRASRYSWDASAKRFLSIIEDLFGN